MLESLSGGLVDEENGWVTVVVLLVLDPVCWGYRLEVLHRRLPHRRVFQVPHILTHELTFAPHDF
jgi:hypothetical protein